MRRLAEVRAALGDAGAVEAWNEAAAADRRRLLEADLAGGPVHELRVPVPNRPGVIAELALALGRGGVNIVDMALYPAPDFSEGLVALWVAGDEPRDARRGRSSSAWASRWRARERPLRAGRAAARRADARRPTSRSRTARPCSPPCRAEPVSIRNYLDAADTNSTLATVQALGALVERARRRAGRPRHRPARPRAAHRPDRVGNSGTLLRLLPGLAGRRRRGWRSTLDGDESIRSRPVDRIAEPLRRMGATVEARDGRFPPFTVAGARLRGHRVRAAGRQRAR